MSHLFRPGLLGVCFLALCAVPAGAVVNTTGKIRQWGCWDEEDEACHRGLNGEDAEDVANEKWNDGCKDRCPKKRPYFSLPSGNQTWHWTIPYKGRFYWEYH